MNSPNAIVAYLALFTAAGISFLFINLWVGKWLRPKLPNQEKLEVYECGEPTIGSSFVQFDLRFYVVALLFLIFDVEMALFFPWATVFGKTTHLMDPRLNQSRVEVSAGELTTEEASLHRELGISNPTVPQGGERKPQLSRVEQDRQAVRASARTLALISIADIGVFFAVLLVGFAYVWKRGDLDWVRAVSRERAMAEAPSETLAEEQAALSA